MTRFTNILAVVQKQEDALPVLTRARALRNGHNGTTGIHVLRVVHEGIADLPSRFINASAELKQFVLAAEESALEDDLAATSVDLAGTESATIWNRRTWEGIVHTAEAIGADLVIKRSGTTGAAVASLRTPDDWNLLRHVNRPVLMTHGETWMTSPTVLAAVDPFDEEHIEINERVLRTAVAFAEQTSAALHIVSVYPPLSRWAANLQPLQSYERLKNDVAHDVQNRINTLAASLRITHYTVHAAEGQAEAAIQSTLNQIAGNLLVIGTKARKDIGGVLLGNTSERVLSLLKADVLTVP